MPGEVDLAYVRARRVLLDVLEALASHRDAIVLVGAQAIYLHTDASELAVAEYTTDGDLAIDPSAVLPDPELATTLRAAGFVGNRSHPGEWVKTIAEHRVVVDLMVPESLGGRRGRAANLDPHDRSVARQARGLEAAIVDNQKMIVPSLESEDQRQYALRVAGPAALLIAKPHKLNDRQSSPSRQDDKDALDVYRLLQLPIERLSVGLQAVLIAALSGEVTRAALVFLRELFATPDSEGSGMAARSLEGFADARQIRTSCSALAQEVLAGVVELG